MPSIIIKKQKFLKLKNGFIIKNLINANWLEEIISKNTITIN